MSKNASSSDSREAEVKAPSDGKGDLARAVVKPADHKDPVKSQVDNCTNKYSILGELATGGAETINELEAFLSDEVLNPDQDDSEEERVEERAKDQTELPGLRQKRQASAGVSALMSRIVPAKKKKPKKAKGKGKGSKKQTEKAKGSATAKQKDKVEKAAATEASNSILNS